MAEPKHEIVPVKIHNALSKKPMEWAELARNTYALSMAQVNAALLQKCTPEELATIHDFLSDIDKSSKTFKSTAKKLMLDYVMKLGKKVSKKGSLGLDLGNGRAQYARIKSTQLEQKRVVALLNAKALPLDKHMDVEVSYLVNEVKLQAAVLAGLLTEKEIEACRPEKVYTLGKTNKLGPEGLKEPTDE